MPYLHSFSWAVKPSISHFIPLNGLNTGFTALYMCIII
nr:MAG TPA: hypothetical protein [Caudoviricetes sp.]